MKPSLVAWSLATLALPLLASCANPSHEADAEALRDRLADLPGVTAATLDYTEPVTLDSGKLALRVTMAGDAAPERVADVVVTTYDAFAHAHHREEGDLDIAFGDDVIHLRSFEPDAEVDAVAKAADHAVSVLAAGSVRADINTQDVDERSHVFTTYAVSLRDPGRDAVLAALASLEEDHGDIPDASWTVQGGGETGWLLGADWGFPDAEAHALFGALSQDLPAGATVLLDGDFATLQLPDDTTPDEASVVVGHHLELLGGAKKALYDVVGGPDFHAMISAGDCLFDTGAVGARLEAEHAAGCAKITHPDS